MDCSNVQIEYLGNGARVDYTFPFTYEDESEVHVAAWDDSTLAFVDVERNTWEFLNATTIRFLVPPAVEGSIGARFIIYRKTDLEEMEVTFYPGSSIRAQDLNANFEQLRDAIQEGWCIVPEWFKHYLEEYLWDVNDAITIADQQNERWENTDDKIATAGAIGARTDVYMQDNKPAEPPYEQGGKRWYDTEQISNYIWNDKIKAWVDYARTGPQGPRGQDGHHTVIMGYREPARRPSGEPLCDGDIWFNTCTGETFIRYQKTWLTLGNTGPAGPEGVAMTIIGHHAPTERPNGTPLKNGDIWFNTCVMETFFYYEGTWLQLGSTGKQGEQGEQGETGTYQVICNTHAPDERVNGDPLECGDIWFNSCIGEAFIWNGSTWISFGSPGNPGKDGKDGHQLWVGDKPPLNKDKYPLWYNTDCDSKVGLYAWYEAENVWVSTNTPGPKGEAGPPGSLDNLNTQAPLVYDDTVGDLYFDIDILPILTHV